MDYDKNSQVFDSTSYTLRACFSSSRDLNVNDLTSEIMISLQTPTENSMDTFDRKFCTAIMCNGAVGGEQKENFQNSFKILFSSNFVQNFSKFSKLKSKYDFKKIFKFNFFKLNWSHWIFERFFWSFVWNRLKFFCSKSKFFNF